MIRRRNVEQCLSQYGITFNVRTLDLMELDVEPRGPLRGRAARMMRATTLAEIRGVGAERGLPGTWRGALSALFSLS